jgi:hypothetical protein
VSKFTAAAGLLALVLAGCQSNVTPAETFSRACASVGEAMLGVNTAYDRKVVDQASYDRIANLFDAARATCKTPPADDTTARVATAKVSEFLTNATGVTGAQYGY